MNCGRESSTYNEPSEPSGAEDISSLLRKHGKIFWLYLTLEVALLTSLGNHRGPRCLLGLG